LIVIFLALVRQERHEHVGMPPLRADERL
jgi:hypothetical protein